MANHLAISAVGEALRVYLQSGYPAELQEEHPCTFAVLSSGELGDYAVPSESSVALTLYLYRVSVNEQLRNQFQPGRAPRGLAPALPVDLYWMMTVWASGSAAEHTVFAWALRRMADQTLLDASVLSPDAEWDKGDVLHVLPAELSIEDQMRIWDALEPSYRLSQSYVSRSVRLESPYPAPAPVLATRLGVRDRVTDGE